MNAGPILAAAPGGAGQPSMLDPHGPASHGVEILWWILFGFAAFVFVAVVALGIVAVVRGRRSMVDNDDREVRDVGRPFGGSDDRFIAVGGVAVPMVILLVVGFATVFAARAIWASPPPSPVHIEVEGAQWFWIVHEPDGITTANEIAVPVGRPVEIELRSRDVIHSFWVPQLAPKVDMIPGQTNVIRFTVEKAGIYRGQCAEFCGLQHAHMIFLVDAMPESTWRSLDAPAWSTASRRRAMATAGRRTRRPRAGRARAATIRARPPTAPSGPTSRGSARARTIGAGMVRQHLHNLAALDRRRPRSSPGSTCLPGSPTPVQSHESSPTSRPEG